MHLTLVKNCCYLWKVATSINKTTPLTTNGSMRSFLKSILPDHLISTSKYGYITWNAGVLTGERVG